MSVERTDYPAMLPHLQPHQAVDILNERVRQVGKLNTAIADWLQERRRLEEQYSTGLRRLAKKQLEDVDLGIFSVPWTTLTAAADSMADSHSALASKVEVDTERPLRDFVATNREMQAMSTIQGNLAAIAKEFEKAQQKTDKLVGRGERAEASKVASATTELDNSRSQWDSQAPYVFESLQAVDETRLNHLRDVLTQFQTHEVDLVQRNQTTAEHCLNVLLSLQTEDEIKTFALKSVQGKQRVEHVHRSSIHRMPSNQLPPSRAPTSSNTLTPTSAGQDDESERSPSVQEEKRKSRFGGLKRLGTVVGGKRRESKQPSTLTPMVESPERKQKSLPFHAFAGKHGKHRDAPTLEPTQESPSRERPLSPLRVGSEIMESPSATGEGPSSPTVVPPRVNGASSATGSTPALAASFPNGSHQSDLADLDPPKPKQAEPAAAPEKDNDGFTVPSSRGLDPISQAQQEAAGAGGEPSAPTFNVNIRNAPIQEESGSSEAALASMANKLQAPPSIAARTGTVRGRRQGRPVSTVNSTYFSPEHVPHIPEARSSSATPSPGLHPPAQPALGHSKDISPQFDAPAVQSPGAGASPSLPQSPSGAFGGAAAGAAVGGAAFSPFASTASHGLPLRPESRAAIADHTADTGSIRSGRSLASIGSQGHRHPELDEAGLSSSIVETVSAYFEHGKITSSSLRGEIALAYNPTDFSAPFGSEIIKLENFASLEKVAPNPAFITQTPEKEGEYAVSLSSIAKTQIAFKYQARTDGAGSQAPLLITTALKIEANQTSVIVGYSLNPGFDLHGQEAVTLSNITLALTLDGAKATGCQSKPVGTFNRERNLIYWKLGDTTLKAGAAPGKLLARFTTESEAKSGSVDARWEINGEDARRFGSGLAVSMQQQSSGATGEGADPFADDQGAAGVASVWKDVPAVRKLVSGAYHAK